MRHSVQSCSPRCRRMILGVWLFGLGMLSAGFAQAGSLAPRGRRAVLIRSAASGPWSANTTWEGGVVPAAGARVQVFAGHTVRYDVASDAVLRSIHVAGTLAFADDRDTA